jgi:hypothetical protein
MMKTISKMANCPKQRRTQNGPRSRTSAAKDPAIANPDDRVFYEWSTWDANKKTWTNHHQVRVSDLNLEPGESIAISLSQGGTLNLYPNYVSSSDCKAIQDEVLGNSPEDPCGLLRQYKMQNGDEPRLHALVSCDQQDKSALDGTKTHSACTYKYHGIQMKAHEHISSYPEMEKLSSRAAEDCNLSSTWSTGCDVLLYRNGRDKIGFHADDTQGETVIFCAVVMSEHLRCLHILPAGKKKDYANRDMQVKFYADQGDAYAMDGKCG